MYTYVFFLFLVKGEFVQRRVPAIFESEKVSLIDEGLAVVVGDVQSRWCRILFIAEWLIVFGQTNQNIRTHP